MTQRIARIAQRIDVVGATTFGDVRTRRARRGARSTNTVVVEHTLGAHFARRNAVLSNKHARSTGTRQGLRFVAHLRVNKIRFVV